MPRLEKVEMLVNQLIRQTVEGRVEWTYGRAPHSLTVGTDDIVAVYYEAYYKESRVAVYEKRSRTYDGENDSFYWISTPYIGIVGGDSLIWESPDSPASTWSLLKVAGESASGIDDLLDGLIK